MPASPVARVVRSGFVEGVHCGHAVALDAGARQAGAADPCAEGARAGGQVERGHRYSAADFTPRKAAMLSSMASTHGVWCRGDRVPVTGDGKALSR